MTAAEIWRDDPVHPKDEYSIFTAGVVDVEKSCGSGQAKRKLREPDWDHSTADGGERAQ